jgi:DME family drug/metabolite transporter
VSAHENRARARLFVVVAALLWSTGALGIKTLSTTAAPTIACLRAVFATVVMGIALGSRAPLARIVATARRPRVGLAAVSYAVMVVCFVAAAKLTTGANAILIQYTAPVYVAILSPFLLGERVGRREALAVAATMVGMVLFFMGDLTSEGRLGNVVAVVSSFGFAGLPILLRMDDLARRRDALPEEPLTPLVAMTLGNVVAALVCLPKALPAMPPSKSAWLTIALLGTFQIAVPYLFYASAVRELPALESSLIAAIEPIVSPLWVFLMVGERPSGFALLGGALIVVAVTVQATASPSSQDIKNQNDFEELEPSLLAAGPAARAPHEARADDGHEGPHDDEPPS